MRLYWLTRWFLPEYYHGRYMKNVYCKKACYRTVSGCGGRPQSLQSVAAAFLFVSGKGGGHPALICAKLGRSCVEVS